MRLIELHCSDDTCNYVHVHNALDTRAISLRSHFVQVLQYVQNDKQKLHNKMADSESDDEIIIIGFVLTSLLNGHATKRKRERDIRVREWVGKRQFNGV